jgi:hypothetical protein
MATGTTANKKEADKFKDLDWAHGSPAGPRSA